MTTTDCPELDVCPDHDHAGEQEGDAGGGDGEHWAEVQPTRQILALDTSGCAVFNDISKIFIPGVCYQYIHADQIKKRNIL